MVFGRGRRATLVLPAAPDDVQPGTGQDADGVWVVVAAGACAWVEVGGPGVGVVGVAGEVDDGAAELFVHGPAEGDDLDLAGLAGRGCGAGQAGQRLGGREPSAGVADLGQQPGGADGARPGSEVKMCGVGVGGELLGDLAVEGFDLVPDRAEGSDQGKGDLGAGAACGPVVPRGASCRWAQSRSRLARWL